MWFVFDLYAESSEPEINEFGFVHAFLYRFLVEY